MRIVVGATKGGGGKSTTAVALALMLAERGPTVLVDGDRRTATVTTWWHEAQAIGDKWPMSLTMEPWRDPMTLPPMAHVVIDTGPGDPDLFRRALELCDTAVLAIRCRRADINNVGRSARLVADVARRHPLLWGVLLTQVRLRSLEAREAPAAIAGTADEPRFPLFETVIPDSLTTYGRWPDTVPDRLDAYRDVMAEIDEGHS